MSLEKTTSSGSSYLPVRKSCGQVFDQAYNGNMATLVFDIETVGESFEEMDDVTQHVLTRWIEKTSDDHDEYEAKLADIKNGLGFSPYTGQIVALGIYDVEREKGVVYYAAPDQDYDDVDEDDVTLKHMDEAEMLSHFWEGARAYDTFVSFNGRGFDVPFMNVRSAINGLRPTVDLMQGRYLYQQRGAQHVDLLDQLSYYGAVWKGKPNLHLACRAFGIKSPKEDGVAGDDVAALFADGQYVDIARYNIGDLYATRDLYQAWLSYLKM